MSTLIRESVFDIAAREDFRADFLRHMESKHPERSEAFQETAAYIASDACLEDLARLRSGDYYFDRLRGFDWLAKGKQRLIFTLPEKQSMICSLINAAIFLKYDATFSDSLYFGRRGRSRKSMMVAIRTWPDFGKMHLLRADIRQFDAHTRYAFLAPQIDAFFADEPELCQLLKELSKESDILKDGMMVSCKQSIRTGLPFCSLLNNLYLMDLDRLIENKGFFYLRYCDDILVGGERKEDLESLLEEMRVLAEEIGLHFHPDKTFIADRAEAFSFMNVKICGNVIDYSEKYLQELIREIKAFAGKMAIIQRKHDVLPEIMLYKIIGYINRRIELEGFEDSFAYITTDASLKVLDKTIVDLIRSAASGTTGRKKYRISYDMIKRWGYQSFVNRYYRACLKR